MRWWVRMDLELLRSFVFMSWCVTTAACLAVVVVSCCCWVVRKRRRCPFACEVWRGTWEITNTKTVLWGCLQRGRTEGYPSWLLLGCWRFWESCSWVWVVELPLGWICSGFVATKNKNQWDTSLVFFIKFIELAEVSKRPETKDCKDKHS